MLINMNLYTRIIELANVTGDTMYSLAKHSGVSESVLSRLKSNSQVKLSKKNLILLANYFCVNQDWLLTGEGEKFAPSISKDTLIHDDELYNRFIELSQVLFGNHEDEDDKYQEITVNVELMSTYTNISPERVWKIIYDRHYPYYTEVIDLLKSDKRINANWLLLGIESMFKGMPTQKESERINALVDTITQLQFAVSAKSDTIAALNDRIKQLESQIKK
jgi:transcriptional regulator with XRE-family HTH domain